MESLAQGPLSSGEIAGLFQISAPAVSQHLKILREAGLVQVRIEAQWRIYELDREGVDKLVAWVSTLGSSEMASCEIHRGILDKAPG